MSTKITVTYQNKDYVLEYSRTTAKQIEDSGFVLDQLGDKPATMIPLLVYGAFAKHNRGIKRLLMKFMKILSARSAKMARKVSLPFLLKCIPKPFLHWWVTILLMRETRRLGR